MGRRNTSRNVTFHCPRRDDFASWGGYSPHFDEEREGTDTWREDGTCSYCGSVTPEKFFEYVDQGNYEGTDKGYKVYVDYHGSFGKFYFQHLTMDQRINVLALIVEGKLGKLYTLPYFIKSRNA